MFNLKKRGALLIVLLVLVLASFQFLSASMGLIDIGGIEFRSPTPVANSYINSSTFTVNVTSNITNFGNMTIYLFNASRSLNLSVNFSTESDTYSYSYVGLTEGVWLFNATVMNSSGGSVNSTVNTINVTVDTIFPFYNISAPMNSEGIVNKNYILLNISYNDTNIANATAYLYADDGSLVNSTINASGRLDYNFSGLAEGLYNLNISGRDLAGNTNSTNRSIIVNYTSPVLTSISDSHGQTTISVSYSANKSVNASIKYGTGFDLGSTPIRSLTYSTSGTVTLENLSAGTQYNYNITICDRAGDCVTNGTYSLNTSAASTSDSPSGNSAPSISQVWKYTYSDNNFELSQKGVVIRGLYLKERTQLKIGGESHYVGLVGLTSTQATINVSSTSQQAVFNIGDSKKFEVTNDNYYDLKVSLLGIKDNKANVSIEYIHEAIAASTGNSSSGDLKTTTTGSSAGTKNTSSGWSWSSLTSSKKLIYGIVIGILILLGIGGITYYLMQRRTKRLGFR